MPSLRCILHCPPSARLERTRLGLAALSTTSFALRQRYNTLLLPKLNSTPLPAAYCGLNAVRLWGVSVVLNGWRFPAYHTFPHTQLITPYQPQWEKTYSNFHHASAGRLSYQKPIPAGIESPAAKAPPAPTPFLGEDALSCGGRDSSGGSPHKFLNPQQCMS